MKEYGYEDAELFLTEWNYWQLKKRGAESSYEYYNFETRLNIKGAAFVGAVMCAMQDAPVDMLMYYDAQKPVYAVLPTVDLVATEEKDLSLHHFDRKIYRQHVLERKDLQLSRFTACLFEPATLRELDLRDAVFQDCRFHHVDFSSVKLAGSIWRNCTFADCTFTQVTASSADEDEIYAQPLWENCLFQGVHMQQCDWRGCVLMDCVNDGVKFSDCQLADSGWLSLGR